MSRQTEYRQALEQVTRRTLSGAPGPPGEPSPNGFRRVGLRVPAVRALVRQAYDFQGGLSRGELLQAWHYIFTTTDVYEVAHQAIYFYQHKSLMRTEFGTVRRWIDRCDCWEHSDDLSKIYAGVFEEHPEWVMPWYRRWNRSRNPWKRRQSVVGLLEYAQKRKRVQPCRLLLGFVEPLLDDDDYYVQKGVGWTLREIYNVYPEQTHAFLKKNVARLDPRAWPAATEKLGKAAKAQLNGARRAQRPRRPRTPGR